MKENANLWATSNCKYVLVCSSCVYETCLRVISFRVWWRNWKFFYIAPGFQHFRAVSVSVALLANRSDPIVIGHFVNVTLWYTMPDFIHLLILFSIEWRRSFSFCFLRIWSLTDFTNRKEPLNSELAWNCLFLICLCRCCCCSRSIIYFCYTFALLGCFLFFVLKLREL